MAQYCIGIDTGGTFTDAVLMDKATGKVVCRTKERTTHQDLGIGVGKALAGLFTGDVSSSDVDKIAVSTTLATNAVVEGMGARVGLFVIGYVKHFNLPVAANIYLDGGHDVTGKEEQPLNLEELVDTVEKLRGEVDSYAVCASMSIQNPAHELVAEKAISLLERKPVFCSHKVSTHPGMRERAATACLHAGLMPLMRQFIDSVQKSMMDVGLDCPVVMISGNCQGIALKDAVERAAVTVASGPASTAVFGASVEGGDGLVVDVGGTTTDICLIKAGKPMMSTQGCRIGPWQTHVEAVDMYTGAAGGDSHLLCSEKGVLSLGNMRVQPLCMTENLPDPDQWFGIGLRESLIIPTVAGKAFVGGKNEILDYLRENGSATPLRLAEKTRWNGITLEKQLERLHYQQYITMVGFTPTDVLHVLNKINIGDRTVSVKGAAILADALNLDIENLCKRVVQLTEEKIEKIILEYLGRTIWGEEMVGSVLDTRDNELFNLSIGLKMPIIGIGAAAAYFLPGVARRLSAELRLPEHYEVGNGVGAALLARGELAIK